MITSGILSYLTFGSRCGLDNWAHIRSSGTHEYMEEFVIREIVSAIDSHLSWKDVTIFFMHMYSIPMETGIDDYLVELLTNLRCTLPKRVRS